MKTYFKILILGLILVNLGSCSNIKVLASWKADYAADIQDNNVLVIAKTDNTQARVAFENEIAEAMRKKGAKATASFTVLPQNIKLMDEPTEESRKAFRNFLETEGYDAVVLSVVKDEQETTKTYTDGGYYAGATTPFYQPYYLGFYSYYYHPLTLASTGVYVEPSSTSYTYKSYVLETVAYDLTKEEGKRLVAVVTSKVENPQDLSANAESYTKKITKAFE
jgi:hypothetical protein